MPATPKITGMKKRQAIDQASKSMLLWVTAAAVMVSVLLVGAQFFYKQFTYNRAVLAAKNEAAATLEQNLENIEELRKAFGPLNAGTNPYVNTSKILSALPAERDTSAFGTSLQQVFAPKAGVSLVSAEVDAGGSGVEDAALPGGSGQTVADPQPQEIQASIAVTGNYEQIAAFVRALELSIRPITVTSIDLTGTDTNLRASINLTTYYQPAKEVTIVKEELPR